MANKSMAIWCLAVPGAPAPPTSFEGHVNFWRIAGDPDFTSRATDVEDFLEIGVMIGDIQKVDAVRIYVPMSLDESAVYDCSRYFRQESTAQGIFNEVVRSTTATPPNARAIELSGHQGVFCRVHSFMMDGSQIHGSELTVEQTTSGTLISVTSAAVAEARRAANPGAPTYFRLRIMVGQRSAFVEVIPPVDRLFQSAAEEIDYIDFRLNEARTLPSDIETMMRQENASAVSLEKVAFLTAIPITSSISETSHDPYKLRVLEQDLWARYVPHSLPPHMMVFHWKRGGPVQDFSAFVKFGTRRSSWTIVWKYLGIAFAFGVLGNLFASLLLWLGPQAMEARSSAGDQQTIEKPATPTGNSAVEKKG
jgi:hypothetical protein